MIEYESFFGLVGEVEGFSARGFAAALAFGILAPRQGCSVIWVITVSRAAHQNTTAIYILIGSNLDYELSEFEVRIH